VERGPIVERYWAPPVAASRRKERTMADAESSPQIEDLDVDVASADSVRGGMSQKQRQSEIARLEKHGYRLEACELGGDLYVNPKTHKTKIVPYVR
jgi:hypothetical protein